jgi:hypothetical protein
LATFNHFQENFNGGEWSPLMSARVSLAKYPNAVYQLQNFILDPRGPAVFRPGWIYKAGTKLNAKASVFIPFKANASTAYAIEFGDYYIRFYKASTKAQIQTTYAAWAGPGTDYYVGNLVIESGNDYRCIVNHTSAATIAADIASGYWEACNPATGEVDLALELPSPYAAADLAGIKYCGSADVLYLWHEDYAPRKLSRSSDTDWTLSTITFRPGAIDEQGIQPAQTLTLAAVTGSAVVFTAGGASFQSGDVGRIITAGVGRASIVSFTSSTVVTCEILDDFSTVGPYASGEWTLNGSPNGTLTPSAKEPVGSIITLTGSGATQIYTNLLDRDDPVTDDWIASGSGTNEFYLVNTAAMYVALKPDHMYENDVEMLEGAVGSLGVQQWDWGDNDALGYDTIYVRLSDGADPDSKSVPGAFDEDYLKCSTVSATTDLWRSSDVGKYVEIHSGLVKITVYTSTTVVSGEIIKELSAITATASWKVKSEIWNATNGYPRCATFYEDRLCPAGSTAYPETVWGSVTGDYENMTPGSDDSDSFSFTIGGKEVSAIRWIEPDEYLLVGADNKVTRLGPDSSGEVLTPTNVNAKPQSHDGAADLMPVAAGNSILYVMNTGYDNTKGLKIGELTWSWEKEKYVTPDMSLLANHIAKGGMTGIAWQKEPNSILYCVRSDGELEAMTYLREQDVIGWHSHPTDGEVESICTIPGDGYDQIWAIIKRTVGGSDVRYVELMAQQFDDDAATYTSNKGLNAFFVDCGITYNGAAATVITGLTHLEGETVVALADGSYAGSFTVASGKITLTTAATVVHVGLPYTGIIQTMRPEIQLRDGTIQGKVKKVNRGYIRVNESGPFKVGVSETVCDDVYDPERVLTLGGAYPLFTGDVPFSMDDRNNRDGRIMIVQDKPMPLTVCGIIQEVTL